MSFADERKKRASRQLRVWLERHRSDLSAAERDGLVREAMASAEKTRRQARGTFGGWAIGRLKQALVRFDRQKSSGESQAP